MAAGVLSAMLLTVHANEGNTLPFVPLHPADTPTEPDIPINPEVSDTPRPENSDTREQAMAILHRYAIYREQDCSVIFPMIPQYEYSLWAEKDILWADMVGITEIGIDLFDMTTPAVRAEIAVYLMKFCVGFDIE